MRLWASSDDVERAVMGMNAMGTQTYQRRVLKRPSWQPVAVALAGAQVDQVLSAVYLTEVYRSVQQVRIQAAAAVGTHNCLQA